MRKEHKIFLSTCGSILAVVAIAIILSINAGGSFAVKTANDYYCSNDSYSVVSNGNGGYVCCPATYTWETRNGTQGVCAKETENQCLFGEKWTTGMYSGYCVAEPMGAIEKTYSCYYCGASNSYSWESTRPSGCSSTWTTVSSVTNEADCSSEACYLCGGSSQGGGTYTWGRYASSCTPQSSYTSKSSCESNNNNNTNNTNNTNNNNGNDGGNTNNNNNDGGNTNPTTTTYSVVYDANGGMLAVMNDVKEQGVDLTLTTVEPLKNGYTFVKWNTKRDGSGTSYNSGGVYSTDADVTLYAIYEESERYTVTYDANGGNNAPDAQFRSADNPLFSSITLTDDKPTRSGYTFEKWNTKSDGSGTSYNPGDKYSDDADITLYAIWKSSGNSDSDKGVTPTDDTNDTKDKTDEELSQNLKTGNTLMIIAWVTAFAALCFTALYLKRKSDI